MTVTAPTNIPASAPLRVIRGESKENSTTGPNAAPKPAHSAPIFESTTDPALTQVRPNTPRVCSESCSNGAGKRTLRHFGTFAEAKTGTLSHDGDGLFFYASSQLQISEGRSVSIDYDGNIFVCESDWGYVRRIRFRRMTGGD